jgi:hypothetical protein
VDGLGYERAELKQPSARETPTQATAHLPGRDAPLFFARFDKSAVL